jgi:5-methylcytosine-specific restriction endonuclease McrA
VTRAHVRSRDGNECVECGSTIGLQVHHLEAVGDGHDPFDVDRLVTLCSSCHAAPSGIA